VSAEGGT